MLISLTLEALALSPGLCPTLKQTAVELVAHSASFALIKISIKLKKD